MKKFLEQKIGEPIAILCRYWYRGIIEKVEEDYVVLSNCFAVEQTGKSTQERPNIEDRIPCEICVCYQAIELICQPTWCFAGYDYIRKE